MLFVVCCLFACLFVFLFVCLFVGWLFVCLLVVVGVVVVVVAVVVAVAVAVFRIVAVPLSFVVHCSLHRSRCPAPFFWKNNTFVYLRCPAQR